MSEGHSDPELPDEFAPLPLLPASFSACPLPSPTTGLQPACLSASTTTGLSPAKNSFRSPLRPGRARKPQEVARRASRLQKRYRQTHPGAVERNRQRQHFRDQSRRLRSLVKNNLALDLRRCSSEVWLLGPAADELVKNNLAASQQLILQPVEPFPSVGHVSCKEHPSGLAGGCGL